MAEAGPRPGRLAAVPLVLRVGAVVVAVQAVILALAFQPMPHTGGDNAAYLTLAHSLVAHGAYLELWEPGAPGHAKYPPVFPLLLAGIMALGGATWTAFKWLSVLLVSLSVILTFAWVAGRRGAFLAGGIALVLAVSDAFLAASHWILSEPPFLAFSLLAFWAADRAGGVPGLERWWAAGSRKGAPADAGPFPPAWVVAVGVAAILAYFTRSAGLPLVVAVGVWLALARRWRMLGGFAGSFLVLALLWIGRARRVGEDDYISEFWLVNPYEPALGTVGAGDLVARVVENLRIYVLEVFPGGIVGPGGGWVAVLGILLAGLAVAGWGRRAWKGPGLAELFAPLYLGLILIWPEVWSGDRFALPLYPLLLFYAGETLLDGARAVGGGGRTAPAVAGGAAFLILVLPALGGWLDRVEWSAACRDAVEERGPYVCQPPGDQLLAGAAAWSSAHLPEGAAVYSRKPRIFYLLSGVPSRMYPLDRDPSVLLEDADRTGVEFLLLDQVDGLSSRYLVPLIQARPTAFCQIAGWEGPGGGRTILFRIRPPAGGTEAGGSGDGVGGGAPREGEIPGGEMEECPPGMVRSAPTSGPRLTVPELPILQRGVRGAAP